MFFWRIFNKSGVPSYLSKNYWWAYLWKTGVWLFDHSVIINAILFGQYRRLMHATIKRFEAGSINNSLQLTCVYGHLTPNIALRSKQSNLFIADVAQIQLQLAKSKLQNNPSTVSQAQHLVRMNAETLAFKKNSFNAIVIFFLLHEMPHEARLNVLSEAIRVLVPDGRLLITEYATLSTTHMLHTFLPFKWIITTLEPFLGEFWQQDLKCLVQLQAKKAGKQLQVVHEEYFFNSFYRIIEFKLE